ncbi:chymotrypsin family serine protease [Tsukamurella soli]
MGVSIYTPSSATEAEQCTIGWPVIGQNGSAAGTVGYLTAGHCVGAQGATVYMKTTDGEQISLEPFAAAVNSPVGDGTRNADGTAADAGIIYLPPAIQHAGEFRGTVAPGIGIVGGLSVSQVRALGDGTPVCMMGGHVGLVCGTLTDTTASDFGVHLPAVHGDSGSGVFVVDPAGHAYAIGLLSSGDTVEDNRATYLAPILDRWSLNLGLS